MRVVPAACASVLLLGAPAVHADTMDPALSRLVASKGCLATNASGVGSFNNPAAGFTRCEPDNAAFAKLVAQYGFAIAPTAMHSARTVGYGGFEFAIEGAYTKIDSDAEYWKIGTEGPRDESSNLDSVENKSPDSFLQQYSVKVRKGFPFGLEVVGNVGFLAKTSIVTGGADVRLSLLEGFRSGIPAIFPEVAIGGGVRTITGLGSLQITVPSMDVEISKPVPIGSTVVLTPYVGYQWFRIFGDSGLVDLTPNTDPVVACGFDGIRTSGDNADGQPICSGGSSADFNNSVVLDPVRLTRHRLQAGAQVRVEMVKVGLHAGFDLMKPEEANQGSDYEDPTTGENKFAGVSKQWMMAFDVGAVF